MSKERRARVGARDNETGVFARLKDAEQRPKDYTKEHIPLPGHGDTGRYDKPKK